jgi:hypothetical protein
LFDDGPVELDSSQKMHDVMAYLGAAETLWAGGINMWPNESGETQFRLFLNDDKGNKIVSLVDQEDGVLLGEYLHMTYGRMLVLSASEVDG